MSDSEDDAGFSLDSVFTEPPRPPSPEPTFSVYERVLASSARENQWDEIKIRLVGSHPLWGHYLWNAARSFASYLDLHPDLYRNKFVLELGAGGGLPGIVAAKNGARKVVLTDYPDATLIDNLIYNVESNIEPQSRSHAIVKGYIWGQTVAPLLEAISSSHKPGFNLIIMSDLVFNHSQHDALLDSCDAALAHSDNTPSASDPNSPPTLLVFYTHHRPHLAERDLNFFRKARERGWVCEEIVTEKFPPMFPEDSGEEEVRATVHGWRLTRAHDGAPVL